MIYFPSITPRQYVKHIKMLQNISMDNKTCVNVNYSYCLGMRLYGKCNALQCNHSHGTHLERFCCIPIRNNLFELRYRLNVSRWKFCHRQTAINRHQEQRYQQQISDKYQRHFQTDMFGNSVQRLG